MSLNITLGIAAAFVIQKEKQPIFADRSANRSAKNISDELRLLVGLTVFELGLLVEVVVGGEEGVAVVFVGPAVEGIGATLGDEGDLRAGAATGVGIGVGGSDAKFLDGILSDAQDAVEGITLYSDR